MIDIEIFIERFVEEEWCTGFTGKKNTYWKEDPSVVLKYLRKNNKK